MNTRLQKLFFLFLLIILCFVPLMEVFSQEEVSEEEPSEQQAEAVETDVAESNGEEGAITAEEAFAELLLEPEETVLGELLFSVKDEINTIAEIVNNMLYKGATLYWKVEAGARYAVIARSNSLDTLIRLSLQNITTYRDLYLGEDAGIVFTPSEEEEVAFTIFSTGKLDGTWRATDYSEQLRNSGNNIVIDETTVSTNQGANDIAGESVEGANAKAEEKNIEHITLGEYTVQVYKLPENPPKVVLPFSETAELSVANTIAHRAANEYRIDLEQDTRVYARMSSNELDTLLEVSDRFGRTVISDDWGEGASLITFVVPSSDEYFVTATSFDGARIGPYEIEITTTAGEEILQIDGQVTPTSPKILQKYASEHNLDLPVGQYMTAEIQPLDNTLEVAFVDDSLNAIHFTSVLAGETKVIPLFASKAGAYKLLVLSNQKVVSNYLLTLFQ